MENIAILLIVVNLNINREGKVGGFIGYSTDITERKLSENKLKKAHQELIQYSQEMSLINELNSYLQICRGIKETYPVIAHYLEQVFPDWVGGLYLFNDKKTLVESINHGEAKTLEVMRSWNQMTVGHYDKGSNMMP